MKNIFLHAFLFIAFIFPAAAVFAQQGAGNYICKTTRLPATGPLFTSFYVNDMYQVFLPTNGGIYLPADSLWFLPPATGYYFTSFAPNIKDTGFFTFANMVDSSVLFYVKAVKHETIIRRTVVKLEKGIYNLILKNGACFIWGRSGNQSKIGVLVKDRVKWLFAIRGVIRQVQVSETGEVFFAAYSSIYNLNTRHAVLIMDKPVYGFCFDQQGQIVVSTDNGIGIVNDKNILIIATGLAGIVESRNEKIFICSNGSRQMHVISKR